MQPVRHIGAQHANYEGGKRRIRTPRIYPHQVGIQVVSHQGTTGNEHQPPQLHKLRMQGNRKRNRRRQHEHRERERRRKLKPTLLNIQNRTAKQANRIHRRGNADHQAQKAHARRNESSRRRHRETVNRILNRAHQTRGRQEHDQPGGNHQRRRNRLPRAANHGMIPAQPNCQECQQTRARRHAEKRGHANLIEPLNQQIHGNEHDRRSGCGRPARPQRRRQRGCAANIRQPGNQRRIRFRMVRNLAQAKVGILQGHAALGNIVNQPVGRSERLIILGRGAHHAHERMGEPGIGAHGSRADARLHVNIGVGGVVDGHRLVGDINIHRIKPIRRRHRNNRRVYVHRIRAIVEHGFRQAQREIEGVAGVLFLAVQGLTPGAFFAFGARGELSLGYARNTARRRVRRRLTACTHEGT